MSIYLTAILKSKKECVQDLKVFLEKLVDHSRKEEACEKYELHQGLYDKTIFVFHEIWKNKDGLDAHNEQIYFKEFASKSIELLENPPEIYLSDIIK